MKISLNVDSVSDWKRALTGNASATFIWIDNEEDGTNLKNDASRDEHPRQASAPSKTARPFDSTPIAWLAEAQDIIVTRHPICPTFASYARKIQSTFPRIFPLDDTVTDRSISQAILLQPTMLAKLKAAADANTYLFPSYASSDIGTIAKLTGISTAGNPRLDSFTNLNDKCYGRELTRWLGLREIPGTECRSMGQLRRTVCLASELAHPILAKEGNSANGKNITPILSVKEADTFLSTFSALPDDHIVSYVVESYLRKKLDFCYQFYADADGTVTLSAAYRIVNAPNTFSNAYHQAPMGLSTQHFYDITDAAAKIGKALYQQGHRGMIGIDGIVDVADVLYPVVDINPRLNSSTICTGLIARLKPAFTHLEMHLLAGLPEKLTFERVRAVLAPFPLANEPDGGIAILKVRSSKSDDGENRPVAFDARVKTLVVAATEGQRSQLVRGLATAFKWLQRDSLANTMSTA